MRATCCQRAGAEELDIVREHEVRRELLLRLLYRHGGPGIERFARVLSGPDSPMACFYQKC